MGAAGEGMSRQQHLAWLIPSPVASIVSARVAHAGASYPCLICV
jgi:hypothetical protein